LPVNVSLNYHEHDEGLPVNVSLNYHEGLLVNVSLNYVYDRTVARRPQSFNK
jgi:hypothetical protein